MKTYTRETRKALHKATQKVMRVQHIERTNRQAPQPGTVEWIEYKAATHTGMYL